MLLSQITRMMEGGMRKLSPRARGVARKLMASSVMAALLSAIAAPVVAATGDRVAYVKICSSAGAIVYAFDFGGDPSPDEHDPSAPCHAPYLCDRKKPSNFNRTATAA
ncbi:MAG: hypothetical protein AAF527_04430 [Pseudomonadota bacterium]